MIKSLQRQVARSCAFNDSVSTSVQGVLHKVRCIRTPSGVQGVVTSAAMSFVDGYSRVLGRAPV